MGIISCMKRIFRTADDNKMEKEIKAAETVHDAGLTDSESTLSHSEPEFKNEALKDKNQNPYKQVK